MFETIEKLRNKPERKKKQIAFTIAFSIAGLIFVVWLSVIYPDFRKTEAQEEEASKLQPSPLSVFGDSVSSGFNAIEDEISGLKETMEEMASSTATSTVE